MLIKVDMAKAYDRILWPFLKFVLQNFGFHPIWINWIMQCVPTLSLNIFLNGCLCCSVKPTNGLRKGDPFSLFLFIICSEILTRILPKAKQDKLIKGIKIGRNWPTFNHFYFTDDLLLFGIAKKKVATELITCLHKYCCWSEQLMTLINHFLTLTRTSRDLKPWRLQTSCIVRGLEPLQKNLGPPWSFPSIKLKTLAFCLIESKIK